MSTSVESRPETRTITSIPKLNHYAPNREITESIVFGTKVTGLCGERFVVHARGNGSTADSKRMTCPMCAHVYESMPVGN